MSKLMSMRAIPVLLLLTLSHAYAFSSTSSLRAARAALPVLNGSIIHKPKPKPKPLPGSPSGSIEVFESKLYALDGTAYQHFGHEITANAMLLAVSTDQRAASAARVYLYSLQAANDSTAYAYTQAAILHSARTAYNGYGLSMAMSDDMLVVGAPYDDEIGYLSGSVYVYNLTSFPAVLLLSTLTASNVHPLGALYGSSLSMQNGLLAVGAPMDSASNAYAGAVYLYRYQSNQRSWQEEVVLEDANGTTYDQFGVQVAIISSTSLAVAASGYSHKQANAGAVYIYSKQAAQQNSSQSEDVQEDEWVVDTMLYPGYSTTDASFGYKIAFTESYGLVSAYTDSKSGLVYVYEKAAADSATDATAWTLSQVLYPTDTDNQYNEFGASLSFQTIVVQVASNVSDSDYTNVSYTIATVGAPGDQSDGKNAAGAVYVYAIQSIRQASDGTRKWQLVAKFTGNDTESYSSYGDSVYCGADGSLLVAATMADTPIAAQAGAVYIEHELFSSLLANGLASTDEPAINNSSDDHSTVWSWLRELFTSSAGIVGMACLPAAVFVILILFQAHRGKWSTHSTCSKYDALEGLASSYGMSVGMKEQAPSDTIASGPTTQPDCNQEMLQSPNHHRQVLSTVDIYSTQHQEDVQQVQQDAEQPADLLNRGMRSIRQMLTSYATLATLEPSAMAAGPAGGAGDGLGDSQHNDKSVHSMHGAEEDVQFQQMDADPTLLVNPMYLMPSTSAPALASADRLDERKRDLLTRMHWLMNRPENPISSTSSSPRVVRSSSFPSSMQEQV